MDILQIIVLALVQGLTEFLPISSSAHLILVPQLLDWPDQGLAFDVAVHIGTLTAVIWYFRKDIKPLFMDWLASIQKKQTIGQSTLSWGIILGTIPVGIAGLLLSDYMDALRLPIVIATTTIIFGLVLWWADSKADKNKRTEHEMTILAIIVIGCAQAIALVPGTSRSGITISAALLLGYSRTGASRFSFLLSIPVILLAGALEIIHLIESPEIIDWSAIIMGSIFSAISAYYCIVYFLRFIENMDMKPFIIYRLLLGGFLLVVFLP
ncbi:MAG: undecaprenyl-diphosphate phosphatase [Gammaproteobacteria bacterium]|nr:undecaprenyl-diphosphate phosphatase [Gammaproteobacteria bacterium]